ncbi:MAG: hypothetical protein AAF999_13795 [Pseudomonadota bacterium]
MSGFFDRIARQAAGSSRARLRSSLELPFANVPPERPTAAQADPLHPEPAMLAPQNPPPDEQDVLRDHLPAAEVTRATHQTTTPPVSPIAATLAQSIAPVANSDAERPAPDQRAPTPPQAKARNAAAHTAPLLGPAEEDSDSNSIPKHPTALPGRFADDLPQPPEAPRAGGLPDPLVPTGTAVTRDTPTAQPDAPSMLRPAQPPEPRRAAQEPEVHVHIGRVEVTSVAEPAPVQPKRPARRAPQLSLEAHLAKRQGGSS